MQTSPSVSTTSQTGSFVAKHRCGHAVCADCYDNAIHRGWNRCTLCRKSGTTRRVRVIVIPNNNNGDGDSDEDLSVFIRLENAAVAAEPVASNSDDFVPRHAVVEHSIKRHPAKMKEHSEAFMGLITQLSIHRNEYDLHKRLLQVCFDEQATFHTPTTAAAAAAAEEPDDKDKESSSNDSDDDDDYVIDPTSIIATYDNTADAAAAVTITVEHTNHPMQLSPDNNSNDNDNSNTDNATNDPISYPLLLVRGQRGLKWAPAATTTPSPPPTQSQFQRLQYPVPELSVLNPPTSPHNSNTLHFFKCREELRYRASG